MASCVLYFQCTLEIIDYHEVFLLCRQVRRAHMRPQLRSVNDTATAAATGGAGGGGGTGTTLVNGEATTLIERRESKSVVALNGTSPMSDNGHGGGKTHLSISSPRRGGTNASCKANGR